MSENNPWTIVMKKIFEQKIFYVCFGAIELMSELMFLCWPIIDTETHLEKQEIFSDTR